MRGRFASGVGSDDIVLDRKQPIRTMMQDELLNRLDSGVVVLPRETAGIINEDHVAVCLGVGQDSV